MGWEGRAWRLCRFALSPIFVFVAGSIASGGTTPIGGSSEPSLTQIFAVLYPNGETLTRVDDFVDGGGAAAEGLILDLVQDPIALTGRTDQTWQDGLANVTVQVKYAGYNHTIGWERNGAITPLFAVFGSGYDALGSATNVDFSGGPFRWIDETGFNVWSSDVSANTDHIDHMITFLVTGGATNGTTWALCFDDQSGGGDRDFNDVVIEITMACPQPPECDGPCAPCARTGNALTEITLVDVDFNGTNTTFTYQVCQAKPSPNLSHWVLGLSAECIDRLVSHSGTSVGYDPRTGITGVKFETNGGVAGCDGVCGDTGPHYTVTFSGEVGIGCVTVGSKSAKKIGYACVQGPECGCTSNKDCADGNPCTNDVCLEGECTYTNNTNPCSDGNACTTNDTCSGGTCVGGPALNCDDGNVCTNDMCNPASGCFYVNNSNPCNDGNACTTNDTCSGGTCVGAALNCNDGNVCTNDSCNPSLGCVYVNNSNPCNDGNACTTNDTCSGGTCTGGPPLSCNDGNVCTDDSCSPASGCVHVNNSGPCNDGNACTTNDTCSGGTCTGGPPLSCNDGNVCTDDSCSPASGCVYVNNNAACNDGNACTTGDTCSGGACVGGPALNCDDGNVCTDDSCNPSSGCVHVDNSASCNDGNACTTNDTCSGGACIGGAPPNCDDGNVCTDDSCNPATGCAHVNNSIPCSGGNACTTGDTCSGGACVGGPPLTCDDGNLCTDDSCKPASGCVYVNNTAPCNDGNACTTNDACSAGACVGGAALNCNDGNGCTDDSCNPAFGCVHVNNAVACDDGNACTTNDTCSGGTCVGGLPLSCDDGNVCTNDSCNPASGCAHSNNTDPCNDGNACTTNDTCAGGTCVGGAPPNCDDGNVCTDDSCNPASGCVNANNTASCNDGNACTTGDACVSGVCIGGPPPTCNDGNICTDDSCNPSSGCVFVNNSQSCDDGDACTTNDVCSGGTCVGGPALDCDDGNVCTDDSCDSVLGCQYDYNTDPCDDGHPCTDGDVCANGQCAGTWIPDCIECDNAGECNDGNPCTDDSCEDEVCVWVNNSDPCDDGNACTVSDACSGGTCVGGPAPNCDDGNLCTDDTCDPMSGCVHTNNAAPCNDGNACTTNDTCSGGTCVGGPPPTCNDGNICTDDSCNPASGCVFVNNTASCNDGDACTTSDTCSDGACVGGPALSCDDGNVCTDDSCNPASGCVYANNSDPCNDGDACTTGDTCIGGTCVGGPPPNCEDGNVCTDDSCNPSSGCVYVNNSSPCNDGNACTTGDTCSGGACVGGAPLSCNDGNVCTDDSCNPALGCVYVNNNDPCNDGNACTTGDTCSGGACVGGPPLDCNDGNGCTDDSCNPATGCAHLNNSNPCNDGDACTTNDTCSGGACVGGAPLTCDDGNVCTNDSCNPASGCVYVNNNASCTDGDACTTGDTCSGGACVGGPPLNCDDGNVCTNDSCNPSSGCVYVNNSAACNDGNACTTDDTCSGGTCVGGPPLTCNDGNVCTDDSCNPALGCAYVNNNAPCSDGNACTTGDTCSGGTCAGGAPLSCNDGNICTDDSCNPASGCTYVNNTNPCNDGNACTTNDTCSGGTCVGGPPPTCNDGNICTDDSCNPASGCVFVNNTAPCDDGLFCTAVDQCANGACSGGNDPCPGQMCDEVNDRCVDCFEDDDCGDDDECTTDACVDGQCVYTPIFCTNSSDCPPGALCIDNGCVCGQELTLCLEALDGPLSVDNCYALEEVIVVNVVVDNALSPIIGGEFYVGYDPQKLEFVSIEPGVAFDPTSPFTTAYASMVDEAHGTIFYAVGISIGGTGTTGPAVMATLVFVAKTECHMAGVCFLPDDNPYHTRLVDAGGNPLVPSDLDCCTGGFNINGSPPEINCPSSVVVDSDAKRETAVVTWPQIFATDNCDGNLPFDPPCTAIFWESGEVGVGPSVDLSSYVLPTGGEFPQGITQITCTAANSCGVSSVCQFTVTVSTTQVLEIEVQLSPIIDPGPMWRCVEFVLYPDCVQGPLDDAAVLIFGPPWNYPGYAREVEAKIPAAGQYGCITARDPLHTLRAVAPIEIVGTHYRVVFAGDPIWGGNWLVGGNFNGDDVIDILDFGTFVSEYLSSGSADTICGAPGPNADVNADGLVDVLDFAFVLGNFLTTSKDSCCPDGTGLVSAPTTEISVRELDRRGLSRLRAADLNGDGLLNVADVNAFTAGNTGPGQDGARPASRLDRGKKGGRRDR